MTRHVEVEGSELVARHAPLIASAMPHIAHPAIRNRGTFGGSIAFADPAAELPACAVALEARMTIAGKGGRRTVGADSFFRGLYETAVGPGEILTAVEVPKIAPGWRSGFMELARRHGDYAIIGLAAHVGGRGRPLRRGRAARILRRRRPAGPGRADRGAPRRGGVVGTRSLPGLADSLTEELDPFEDLNADAAMRRHLAGVLARRTLAPLVSG